MSPIYPDDGGLFADAASASKRIAALYENCDYQAAMREIMVLADRANQYIEAKEPWKLRKDATQADELRDICTIGLNLFRQIVVYLAPVLPHLAEQTSELLNQPIESWDEAQSPLTGNLVSTFHHMMQRVDPQKVSAMIEESRETNATDVPAPDGSGSHTPEDSGAPLEQEPLLNENCSIDDFTKVDLRMARVVEADHVPGADKLLRLKLSLGGSESRQVFAGIKSAYQPDDLVGRLVICCANLAPRKMRFGVSEGMVLACGPGGKEVFLLNPDTGAQPGMHGSLMPAVRPPPGVVAGAFSGYSLRWVSRTSAVWTPRVRR